MHVRAHAAFVACAKIGSQILLVRPDPVSRGPYLSLVGQEVAPGRCRLVAVASSGLYPLPLWISAAVSGKGEPTAQTEFRAPSGSLVSSNIALLSLGQLNCAYGNFCFASEVRVRVHSAQRRRMVTLVSSRSMRFVPRGRERSSLSREYQPRLVGSFHSTQRRPKHLERGTRLCRVRNSSAPRLSWYRMRDLPYQSRKQIPHPPHCCHFVRTRWSNFDFEDFIETFFIARVGSFIRASEPEPEEAQQVARPIFSAQNSAMDTA
jgi:hypothetical protein